MSPDGDLPRLPREFLVMNYRGLALAAFGPVETIQHLLGCGRHEAEEFQSAAAAHYFCLVADIRSERDRGGETGGS